MAIQKNIHGTSKNEFSIGDVQPIAIRTYNGVAQFKESESIEHDKWYDIPFIVDTAYNGQRNRYSPYRIDKDDINRPIATMSAEWIQNYFNVNDETNGRNSDPSFYHTIIRDWIGNGFDYETLTTKSDGEIEEQYLWSIGHTKDWVLNTASRPEDYRNTIVKRNGNGAFSSHEIYLEELGTLSATGTETKPSLTIGGPGVHGEGANTALLQHGKRTGLEFSGTSHEGGITVYKEDGIGFGELSKCNTTLGFWGGGVGSSHIKPDFELNFQQVEPNLEEVFADFKIFGQNSAIRFFNGDNRNSDDANLQTIAEFKNGNTYIGHDLYVNTVGTGGSNIIFEDTNTSNENWSIGTIWTPNNHDYKIMYNGIDNIVLTKPITDNGNEETQFILLSERDCDGDNAALKVIGGVLIEKKLQVTDKTILNDTLDVAKATTLNSTLDVSGATTLSSTLYVTGTTELNEATTLNSTLDVTDITTLKNKLNVTGETTLSSTLDVTGKTTLNNTLYVNEETTLNKATTLNNKLDVTDITTLKNKLNVTGETTLTNTLFAKNSIKINDKYYIKNTGSHMLVSTKIYANNDALASKQSADNAQFQGTAKYACYA